MSLVVCKGPGSREGVLLLSHAQGQHDSPYMHTNVAWCCEGTGLLERAYPASLQRSNSSASPIVQHVYGNMACGAPPASGMPQQVKTLVASVIERGSGEAYDAAWCGHWRAVCCLSGVELLMSDGSSDPSC